MLELILLAGFFRTTSYLVNALNLPLEPQAARFKDYSAVLDRTHAGAATLTAEPQASADDDVRLRVTVQDGDRRRSRGT